MNVLLINGSPRKNGNTFLALSECASEIEKYGVKASIFNIGSNPVRGCIACHACMDKHECVFKDDVLNELLPLMKAADGIIVGSPVYYAGPNGALCALLDRAFFCASSYFRGKAASAVAVCRRGGASAALDRLNKYFTINEMPLVSSQYWNIVYGMKPGDASLDGEGMQTMRTLGRNMAHTVLNLPPESYPQSREEHISTNFIR